MIDVCYCLHSETDDTFNKVSCPMSMKNEIILKGSSIPSIPQTQ